ncbi:hypothetical protein PoB_002144700 [Plakobranchus ocellatus]|uniref:Cysteine-rich and transmembrane domain-containing protein 1 n=1 Tax=Plakobranchus ocellatus TaxID=259542 RepID=A0AAV3ZK72_9GAST|nr:hypothetical protein PoB_002144700 [Plakobranchus ocellatus]
MNASAPPYPTEHAHITQQPIYEPPPPYTQGIQTQPVYTRYDGGLVPGQYYPPQPETGYYPGSQAGYYPVQGPSYTSEVARYHQPAPTEKTIIYVDERLGQEQRQRERREDCCLWAACWAVLCCCILES